MNARFEQMEGFNADQESAFNQADTLNIPEPWAPDVCHARNWTAMAAMSAGMSGADASAAFATRTAPPTPAPAATNPSPAPKALEEDAMTRQLRAIAKDLDVPALSDLCANTARPFYDRQKSDLLRLLWPALRTAGFTEAPNPTDQAWEGLRRWVEELIEIFDLDPSVLVPPVLSDIRTKLHTK